LPEADRDGRCQGRGGAVGRAVLAGARRQPVTGARPFRFSTGFRVGIIGGGEVFALRAGELVMTPRLESNVLPSAPDLAVSPKTDPYPYGWRERPVVREDGTEVWERIPLTLDDLLHPEEG